jgi:small subunit ribosomal protein S2
MNIPNITIKQLLEAGVHLGHKTLRWNPKMKKYIFGKRDSIHIIDLTQTFSLLDAALNAGHKTVSKGGSVLFVGTKRQAQRPIAEAAERSAQYYMNHRWLGGTLTNWKTVSNSISRLKKLDEQLSDGATGLTKKERLNLERAQTKLNASLGGIREMGGLPDLLFVVDSNRESLAIQEAKNLKIPVIAILDTNSDPTNIDFPIPGNDDAARSISLYCDLVAKAALEGMTNQLAEAGVDIGESAEGPIEDAILVGPGLGDKKNKEAESRSGVIAKVTEGDDIPISEKTHEEKNSVNLENNSKIDGSAELETIKSQDNKKEEIKEDLKEVKQKTDDDSTFETLEKSSKGLEEKNDKKKVSASKSKASETKSLDKTKDSSVDSKKPKEVKSKKADPKDLTKSIAKKSEKKLALVKKTENSGDKSNKTSTKDV